MKSSFAQLLHKKRKKVKHVEEESEPEEDLEISRNKRLKEEIINNEESFDESENEPDESDQETLQNTKGVPSNTSTGKYIPPALRKSNSSQEQLETQMRRIINKLSLGNMENLLAETEALYRTHSRNEVNQTLTKCIIDICCDSSQVFSKTVTITANTALITILFSMIGVEVGAFFLEGVAKEFKKCYALKTENKKCDNLILILSHLYNFEVIHCGLIYDLVRMFVSSFTELDIELLLLLLKHSGHQLRSDDPAALKEIILLVQEQAAKNGIQYTAGQEVNEQSDRVETDKFSFRVRFMLQTIYDLKNNKQRSGDDHTATLQVKKQIRNILGKRDANQESALRIAWSELVDANSKGRWWLVGSAWAGRGPELANRNNTLSSGFDDKLLDLAKKHHMNTDVRRAIFCIIMSSEDYLDAFEKLLKLNLKGKQEREIVSIIMHCASQEKKFNEYYAHLAIKFSTFAHSYKFTFQTAFWDKFKQLSEIPNIRSVSNLAHLLYHLVSSNCLSLAVLKMVTFNALTPTEIVFFRTFFTLLLTKTSEENVEKIFKRISTLTDPSTIGLKEGISHFFLQESIHRNNTSTMTEDQMILKKRMKLAKKILDQSFQDIASFY